MKKTTIIGMLVVAIVSLVFSSLFVSAYRGDYDMKGPQCTEERHELINQAFNDANYSAWSYLMSRDGRKPRVLTMVNEDNFERFIEAYNLGKSGNSEEASIIRSELGLNNGIGPKDGNGFRNGIMQENKQNELNRNQNIEKNQKTMKQQGRN